MAELSTINVPPPHDGIDLVSPPESMSPTRALWMENFLIGNYGKLPVRGPVSIQTDLAATADKDAVAVVMDPGGNGEPFITRSGNTAEDFTKIRPDEIPYRVATSKSDLDQGTTYRFNGGGPGQTFFGTGAVVGQSNWGFEYHNVSTNDTQDSPVLNGPRQWRRRLAKLSQTTLQFRTEAQAPSCGVDVEVHNNLLWVLGGYPAAVTTEDWTSSCLFWTGTDLKIDGSLLNNTDVDWRNANGVINRIEIPGDDNGKAIARLGQNLVIFKERSVWILYGSSDDNYTLRNVTSDTGLWDRNSLVEADGGIYFRSTRGIEFFDGVAVSHLSETVAPLFEEAGEYPWWMFRTSGGVLSDSYIEFRVRSLDVTDHGGMNMGLVLHRSTRNWTVFSGLEFRDQAIYMRNHRQFATVNTLCTTPLVDGASTQILATFSPAPRVNAHVYYRPVRPTSHTHQAQLHRAFLETTAKAYLAKDDNALDVWEWKGLSSSQASYPDPVGTEDGIFREIIKAQGGSRFNRPNSWMNYGSAYWQGRRTVVDVFEEVEDIMFKVTYTDPGTGNRPSRAEIRGGAVEFQTASQRRTKPIRTTVPR